MTRKNAFLKKICITTSGVNHHKYSADNDRCDDKHVLSQSVRLSVTLSQVSQEGQSGPRVTNKANTLGFVVSLKSRTLPAFCQWEGELVERKGEVDSNECPTEASVLSIENKRSLNYAFHSRKNIFWNLKPIKLLTKTKIYAFKYENEWFCCDPRDQGN